MTELMKHVLPRFVSPRGSQWKSSLANISMGQPVLEKNEHKEAFAPCMLNSRVAKLVINEPQRVTQRTINQKRPESQAIHPFIHGFENQGKQRGWERSMVMFSVLLCYTVHSVQPIPFIDLSHSNNNSLVDPK